MAVTRTAGNVFYGFADIWVAPSGTAAPTSTTVLQDPAAAGYTSIGFTGEGVELEISKDLQDITVEEQLTPVDTVITALQALVRLQLAEDVIANRALAYGIGTTVTTAQSAGVQVGKKTLTLGETLVKKALLVDVANPLGFTTRMHIPIVAPVGSVQTSYRRAEKRVYPVEFRALCAPSAITILEQNSTS
jgi:hypothetical protein